MAEKSFKVKLKHEVLGILLVALAVCLFLCLVSYHPADPSFFAYSSTATKWTYNWMGIAGSYVASLLFQGCGFSCFLIPLVLGVFAFSFVLGWEWKYPVLKLIGWFVILLALSALFGLWLRPLHFHKQEILPGGFLGDIFAKNFVHIFNPVGAAIVLLVILILAFVLGTGLSFIALVERSGNAVTRWVAWLSTLKIKRKERAKRAKLLVKQKQELEGKEEPSAPMVVEPGTLPKKGGAKKEEIVEQEAFDFLRPKEAFQLPPVSLLEAETERRQKIDRDSLIMNSRILEKKLLDYGVEGKVVEVHPGPVITVYEFEPAPGVKVSRIVGLADDLALALSAVSIRIVAPIPGKSVVGIEIPNHIRETVYLKEIIDSDPFRSSRSKLTFGLGKNISGDPFVVNLARMPHLLVAGSTGSGKSVSINSMICSILFKATPDEVQFLMIDPKMLELSDYDGIPHLRHPVVTNPKKAATVLRWLVEEMERRYTVLAEEGVRNIEHYHQKRDKELREKGKGHKRKPEVLDAEEVKERPAWEKLPYIVVVIDELADLMMISSKEVEEAITRLAQMARAVGIHLLLATQRPSVDVLTGLIKANFPARVSFQTTSRVDSRTILDTIGAEHLLGSGDMLFLPPGSSKLTRIHGAYVSGPEIQRIVDFLKKQGEPNYEACVPTGDQGETALGKGADEEYDEKYDEAVAFVAELGQASISLIQRRFRIGYNRAARIVEKMEQQGVVGPSDGVKTREVLIKKIE